MTRTVLLALLGPLDASWLPPWPKPARRSVAGVYGGVGAFLDGVGLLERGPEPSPSTVADIGSALFSALSARATVEVFFGAGPL